MRTASTRSKSMSRSSSLGVREPPRASSTALTLCSAATSWHRRTPRSYCSNGKLPIPTGSARTDTIRSAGHAPTAPQPLTAPPITIAILVPCFVAPSSHPDPPSMAVRSTTPEVSGFGSTPVSTRQTAPGSGGGSA
jgi:hypothetical protein